MSWRAFIAVSWGALVGALTFAVGPFAMIFDHNTAIAILQTVLAILKFPGLLVAVTVGSPVPAAGINALIHFAICFFVLRFFPAFRTKRIHLLLAGAFVVAIVCVVVLAIRGPLWPPAFPVRPLPAHPRVLTPNEVERVLGSNLSIVHWVGRIPRAVKEDYAKLTGETFDMSNPGEAMNGDDIVPGVPSRRLVLLGLGSNSEVLIFEKGGFADTLNAIVVVHNDAGGAWGAGLRDYSINSISGLREAILRKQYTAWNAQK